MLIPKQGWSCTNGIQRPNLSLAHTIDQPLNSNTKPDTHPNLHPQFSPLGRPLLCWVLSTCCFLARNLSPRQSLDLEGHAIEVWEKKVFGPKSNRVYFSVVARISPWHFHHTRMELKEGILSLNLTLAQSSDSWTQSLSLKCSLTCALHSAHQGDHWTSSDSVPDTFRNLTLTLVQALYQWEPTSRTDKRTTSTLVKQDISFN